MKRVLIVIGHPYWSRSVANKGIVESLGGLDRNIVFSNIKRSEEHTSELQSQR